ncbi:MAG TPA: DUF3455 domain-containing protein [Pyrinomonadaceae bacterium]|nr:DUF3455 domain-containing protein [Pyrinomonadaceae bacterium]
MNIMKIKQVVGLAILLSIVGLGHASVTRAVSADDDNLTPELPAGCEQLAVPAGNRVAYKVYATGVQVYRWNGTAWALYGPEANLFASANYRGHVGTHYVGPTWESNSGSFVVSSGSTAIPCTPDPTAIAWLRLTAVTTSGPGIFDGVTFIQRVNTVGGLRPTAPGTVIGQEVKSPYATEYYFYKAE